MDTRVEYGNFYKINNRSPRQIPSQHCLSSTHWTRTMRKVVSLTCIALLLSIVFVQVEADVSAVQYARAEFVVRRQPRHSSTRAGGITSAFLVDNRRPTLTDSSLPPLSTTNTSVMPRMRTQQVP